MSLTVSKDIMPAMKKQPTHLFPGPWFGLQKKSKMKLESGIRQENVKYIIHLAPSTVNHIFTCQILILHHSVRVSNDSYFSVQ